MKYCAHCGNELLDEAVICPKCGCRVENGKGVKATDQKDFIMVIKIFMIVACVLGGFAFLIPLAWMIPMTVLLFVSVIAGILLFFIDTENYLC